MLTALDLTLNLLAIFFAAAAIFFGKNVLKLPLPPL
jgi:hypothetical protein